MEPTKPNRRLITVAALLVVLALVVGVRSVQVWLAADADACEVTDDGIEARVRLGAEPDQGAADEVAVGDRYVSGSGCVPCDRLVEVDQRLLVLREDRVIASPC